MAGGGFVFSPAFRLRKLRREQIEERKAPMKLTGSQLITALLERQGITTIAGIPGGANLPLYDALQGSSIRHVLARHEQGAGFIAQGMARATGRPAVCLGTSGPGATNLLTAIADAKFDSIPLIAITGQVPRSMIGTDAFQEIDTFGLSLPITKHNFLVRSAAELLEVIPQAFRIAASGRPGPVLVDVPKDVQTESIDVASFPEPGRADPPPLCSGRRSWPRRSDDQRGAKTAPADRRRRDRRGRVERLAESNREGSSAGGGHVARSGRAAP